MSVLIIAYDLGGKNKDYTSLYDAIKKHSDGWCRYITDAWFVSTSKTPDEFTELLLPHIDQKEDVIFVAELKRKYQGWLPQAAWDWLKEQGFD